MIFQNSFTSNLPNVRVVTPDFKGKSEACCEKFLELEFLRQSGPYNYYNWTGCEVYETVPEARERIWHPGRVSVPNCEPSRTRRLLWWAAACLATNGATESSLLQ